MYVYYAIAVVHAVATPQSIRLFVEIPLKAADRYFELYQVHSLPFYHKGIEKFVMIDEPFTYLAVAESRQSFAIITPYMLTKCTQELYTVCPSDMVRANQVHHNKIHLALTGVAHQWVKLLVKWGEVGNERPRGNRKA